MNRAGIGVERIAGLRNRFAGTRNRFAGLAVALLVVGSTVLLAAGPAAATTFPPAEDACATTGDGQHLVGILPGSASATDAQVVTGDVSLYPGTTLRLALCEDGSLLNTYGSEWELAASPGLEVLGTSEATTTVRVTGETARVDVLELVDGKNDVPAVSIAVPQPAAVDSELAGATVEFENATAAEAYAADERAFLDAATALGNATAALNASAGDVADGDADPGNVTETRVPAVLDRMATLDNETADLEREAYHDAFTASGESTVLTALRRAQARERAADDNATAALRNYLGTLETAESNARTGALLNLVGALVAGLVVGAVPGWKLTADRLERIRQDREVNSSVSYSPRVLAWAGGLAAVALGLTAAALVALGGLGTLGGLL